MCIHPKAKRHNTPSIPASSSLYPTLLPRLSSRDKRSSRTPRARAHASSLYMALGHRHARCSRTEKPQVTLYSRVRARTGIPESCPVNFPEKPSECPITTHAHTQPKQTDRLAGDRYTGPRREQQSLALSAYTASASLPATGCRLSCTNPIIDRTFPAIPSRIHTHPSSTHLVPATPRRRKNTHTHAHVCIGPARFTRLHFPRLRLPIARRVVVPVYMCSVCAMRADQLSASCAPLSPGQSPPGHMAELGANNAL